MSDYPKMSNQDNKDQEAISYYLKQYCVSGTTDAQKKAATQDHTFWEKNRVSASGPEKRDMSQDQLPDADMPGAKDPEAERPKKGRNNGGGKGLYFAAALAVIAAVVSVSIALWPAKNDPGDEAVSILGLYQDYAEAAIQSTPSFVEQKWMSASEALDALADLMNPGLPEEMSLEHTSEGNFYITTKQLDPWGQPYYITALQLGDGEKSAYDYYITSSGANQQFDISKFVLDQDDISETLLATSEYAYSLEGEHVVLNPDDMDAGTSSVTEGTEATVPIIFDMTGGEKGTALIEATVGIMLPDITIPVKEGFRFVGYFESADGLGIQYYDEKGSGCFQSPFTQGVTLYAAWEAIAPASTDNDQDPGSSDSLEEQTPPLVEGSEQEEGDAEENQNEIYYTIRHYVMDEDGNYNTQPTATVRYRNVDGTRISLKSVSSATYNNGITTYQYGTVDNQKVTSTIIHSGTVINLYYARNQYSLTITKSDGVETSKVSGTIYAGKEITITASIAPGYKFVGWTGDFTGDKTTLSFVMPAKDITVSAKAELVGPTYSISLNANGGKLTVSDTSIQAIGGQKIGSLPTPTYSGYDFVGWYTKRSGGDLVTADSLYQWEQNITLYAQWAAAKGTAILDNQGGTGGITEISTTYGDAFDTIQVPTKQGYKFMGYFSAPNGEGYQIFDATGAGNVCWFQGTKTFYANWEPVN